MHFEKKISILIHFHHATSKFRGSVMIPVKSLAVSFTLFIFLSEICSSLRTTRIPPKSLKSLLSRFKRLNLNRAKVTRESERSMSDWDAENGVWFGDRATSDDQLPSPLYLFGYGSLLWRPGELLGNFTSSSCSCSGWQRLFAQRSSDHRGSPEFPGFVATLVEATYLEEMLNELSRTNEEFKLRIDEGDDKICMSKIACSGLVWLIPEDRIKGTIAELDYRERGGYHRYEFSQFTEM